MTWENVACLGFLGWMFFWNAMGAHKTQRAVRNWLRPSIYNERLATEVAEAVVARVIIPEVFADIDEEILRRRMADDAVTVIKSYNEIWRVA